jgi:hypothetical protein
MEGQHRLNPLLRVSFGVDRTIGQNDTRRALERLLVEVDKPLKRFSDEFKSVRDNLECKQLSHIQLPGLIF